MTDDFRLLMIGAMYENGGNTTHRVLDGHPELFVYPFESQLGTRHVSDRLQSLFPAKYRWPVFHLDATAAQDYHAIIDEECKVRVRTPFVSKFRDSPFDLSDDERHDLYIQKVERYGRSRAANVRAFFEATFEAWHDHRSSGRESVYVGYSPVITVDAERILEEVEGATFLHVVRNPWSAYADTKKRAVPLSLEDYTFAWNVNQHFALQLRRRHPDRFHILRLEDLLQHGRRALATVLDSIGVADSDALDAPSWNGAVLREVYPWGTIRSATPEANAATAAELTEEEAAEVGERTALHRVAFGYEQRP